MSLQAIIIGSSHAGANVAYNLRKDGFNGKIDLFTKEKIFPYHRPPLSKDFLKNHTPVDKLFFKPEKFYAENHINIHTQSEVDSINPENQYINVSGSQFSYDSLVLATGSSPRKLNLENSEADNILYLRDISDAEKIKTYIEAVEHITLIGGGYIGLEMGSVWSRLGAEVNVIEFLDHITPGMDREISEEFMKILKKQNIKFHLNRKVTSIKKTNNGVQISTSDKNGDNKEFNCDVALISIGRKPFTSNLNLSSAGVKSDEKGRIKIDKKFQTSAKNIYAIGDVIDGPMLAHKAEEEGIAVAEIIAGQSGHVNYDLIPGVIYTTPEVASIGLTEEQLKEKNKSYKIGKFPFMANSRAKAIDEPEGFVKILADKDTDKVLGVHMIGPHVGEMIAEMAVAMEFGASSEDIARTCHAHPTFSEAIKEAALSVEKRQIHS